VFDSDPRLQSVFLGQISAGFGTVRIQTGKVGVAGLSCGNSGFDTSLNFLGTDPGQRLGCNYQALEVAG
jgi:hypothetical protein